MYVTPFTRQGIRAVQRDLDQEFYERKYLLDARDTFDHDLELEARSLKLSALIEYVASVFSSMRSANPLNSDLWSYRKVTKATNKVNKATNQADQAQSTSNDVPTKGFIQKILDRFKRGRHHRRSLEDDTELLRRDFDAEELFGREYDDFLVERDDFDDLD
jgi:hypothetical protein